MMGVLALAAMLLQSPADALSEQAVAAAQRGDTEAADGLWRQAIEKEP